MENIALTVNKKNHLSTVKLAWLFVISFLASAFGGAVSTLMSVYLPLVVKQLQGNENADQLNIISGWVNSVFVFGWAAGGFLWGLVSDKAGRKNTLLLATFNYGVFTMLTGIMPNWPGVVFCRFMSGFGVGGVLVVSFTLLSEVWPAKSKAVYTGILSISFPIGIFCAGLINYFVTSWRQGFLIGIIPILLAIAGYWLIAESDSWLEYRKNKTNSLSPKSLLFTVQNRKALVSGAVIFGTMLIGLWAIFSWLPTWIQSLLTADANKERGLSMMFLGMGGLAGGFFSGWMVKLFGLKNSLIACFAVCALYSFILFKTNYTFSAIIYPEIALLALFFGASQGILSIYIPLLFPIGTRAAGTGFCFNAGRLFTAAAILFIGVLVNLLGGYGNALFIFSLVFIIGLIAVWNFKDVAADHN